MKNIISNIYKKSINIIAGIIFFGLFGLVITSANREFINTSESWRYMINGHTYVSFREKSLLTAIHEPDCVCSIITRSGNTSMVTVAFDTKAYPIEYLNLVDGLLSGNTTEVSKGYIP